MGIKGKTKERHWRGVKGYLKQKRSPSGVLVIGTGVLLFVPIEIEKRIRLRLEEKNLGERFGKKGNAALKSSGLAVV